MSVKKWFCINIKIQNEYDVDVQIFGDADRCEDALIIAAAVRASIYNILKKVPIIEWKEDP